MAPLRIMSVLLVAFCFGLSLAGQLCSYSSGFSVSYQWCDYGCCAYSCCQPVIAVWIIVVIVISCIFFIAIVVTVVCCCIRSRGAPGRIIQTGAPTPGVTVVSTAGQTTWQQPVGYAPGYPIYPQTYGVNAAFNPSQPVSPPAYTEAATAAK